MGKKIKPLPPQDPRPTMFEAHDTEDYLALCERQRAGEFFIDQIAVGNSNAHWIFTVRYAKPYSTQPDLL